MIELKREIKIGGACPRCGDSISSYKLEVRDHTTKYFIYLGWCSDCKSVVAIAKPTNRSVCLGNSDDYELKIVIEQEEL